MEFDDIDADTCQHHAALQVADEFREQFRTLYAGMYRRNAAIGGGLSNMVMAGMTVVWLECVHSLMGSPDSESAIALLRDMRPDDRAVAKEMRMAARDFLRRSRWLPKQRAT
jgi:hypothetical protein